MTIPEITSHLNRYQDAALAAFDASLHDIIERAQDRTIAYLFRSLATEGGEILQTPGNLRIIRGVATVFQRELDAGGYQQLIGSFVGQFPGQLPLVQETLEVLRRQSARDLPTLTWTPADLKLFQSVALSNSSTIAGVVEAEAGRALNRIMFSVGGLEWGKMVEIIRDGMKLTLAQAKSAADTAQASFYRVALDRQYQKIEEDTGAALHYKYSGPVDRRERPFCANLSARTAAGVSWTKEEINAMDAGKGQPAPPFVFGGGWNCRHQFIIDFEATGLLSEAA